jgi:ActR/RegA family two-component response regulator
VTSLLILEDDLHLRSALIRELEGHGFEVRTASTVDEALISVGQKPVDLRLDGQDGIDLLRRLPAISRRTRVVLMSAYATARDHQIATELGAVTVLVKPFTWDELLRTIHKAIDCETGFLGSIHGLSLVDMAQMFHLAQRSISVRVTQPGGPPSAIHFRGGEIVHAEHGGLVGTPALRAILATPSGTIDTGPLAEDTATTITSLFDHLLLESLSQLDEEQHDLQRVALRATGGFVGVEELQVRDDEPGAPSATATLLPERPARPIEVAPTLLELRPPVEAERRTIPVDDPIYHASKPPSALQPALSEACRGLMAAIDAAVACTIVALDNGALIGHHQTSALAEPVGPILAAATHALFAGPALTRLAAVEVGPTGVEVTQEAQLTAARHYLFARVLPDGRSAVALLTRKTINIGMGWALLRSNLLRSELSRVDMRHR